MLTFGGNPASDDSMEEEVEEELGALRDDAIGGTPFGTVEPGEICVIIKIMKNKKTPEDDGITNLALKQ